MADFDPPFAQNGEFRFPNANEQSLGWPCGAIDQNLLNGLFRLHNGNIGNVIAEAGVTGPDGDLTKLRRAIEALIAAATGGGTVDDYILMTQARARLPIFPDVQNVDGRIGVTAPSTGTVRLAGGVEFLHRGIFRVTTTQTDFATDPSKTYHLRWNPTDGFALRDLASSTYNPGTLSEGNVAFDSTYDDMLVARIVTNSSNVATITTLTNRDRLQSLILTEQSFTRSTQAGTGGIWLGPFTPIDLRWSRTPQFTGSVSRFGLGGVPPAIPEEPAVFINGSFSDGTGSATASLSRYSVSPVASIDMNTSSSVSLSMTLQLSATMIA